MDINLPRLPPWMRWLKAECSLKRCIRLSLMTLPAHAMIFTSLYPPEHGVRIDGLNGLGNDVPVLAEFLHNANLSYWCFFVVIRIDCQIRIEPRIPKPTMMRSWSE